ncbi:radical SAM/SPASM domain-containing protein [Desulfurivibrio dismutans]|uniref:radical SAM/SPASM domain-containing protein n=1 Tax=Desulfurivibrio dismutans TaxID=1398908 RepID=UPI0023D9D8A2|nr:radical SAM/SPASM domain-containing protein [Desulfurivibrio alkaliphilus]MDF1615686.1 SPASM domain-containing protein [Desulfurivibrio alkaliphilus]
MIPANNLDEIASANHLTEKEKHHFKNYHAKVEKWRKSHYLLYPQQVHIETQAVCNAKCTFCPHTRMKRTGTRMSDELIAKVIDDLCEIPSSVPFNVCPFKISDPLLDNRLYDIIGMVEEKLPSASVWLATNGAGLTESSILKLAAAKRPLDLTISLNDHRREVYEEEMGIPFERTVTNLRVLYKKMVSGQFPHRVAIGRVSGKREDDHAFIQWVKAQFPAFKVMIKPAGNWAGEVTSRTHSQVLPIGCTSWFQVSITATGDTALCCMDGFGEVNLGNVKFMSVLDIYNSSTHRKYREGAMTRRDVAPCSRCTHPETCGETV